MALTSSTFWTRLSLWVTSVGNLPALLKPGPSRRGICLMRLSEAKKASYFLAMERESEWLWIEVYYSLPSFLTNFLSLFSFFKASTSIHGKPAALASSQCEASPNTHIFILGRGMWRSLTGTCTHQLLMMTYHWHNYTCSTILTSRYI